LELKEQLANGKISKFKRQVKFEIKVRDVRICYYIADFTYRITETGEDVIEDVKGVRTAVFNLKWKLMKTIYPEFQYLIT